MRNYYAALIATWTNRRPRAPRPAAVQGARQDRPTHAGHAPSCAVGARRWQRQQHQHAGCSPWPASLPAMSPRAHAARAGGVRPSSSGSHADALSAPHSAVLWLLAGNAANGMDLCAHAARHPLPPLECPSICAISRARRRPLPQRSSEEAAVCASDATATPVSRGACDVPKDPKHPATSTVPSIPKRDGCMQRGKHPPLHKLDTGQIKASIHRTTRKLDVAENERGTLFCCARCRQLGHSGAHSNGFEVTVQPRHQRRH
jgi:hypothetical protein